MSAFLVYVLAISLIASFILSLMYKLGVVEHVQVYGSEFYAKMFSCNFCLSFWISLIVSIFFSVFCIDATILFVPLFSTNLVKNIT